MNHVLAHALTIHAKVPIGFRVVKVPQFWRAFALNPQLCFVLQLLNLYEISPTAVPCSSTTSFENKRLWSLRSRTGFALGTCEHTVTQLMCSQLRKAPVHQDTLIVHHEPACDLHRPT